MSRDLKSKWLQSEKNQFERHISKIDGYNAWKKAFALTGTKYYWECRDVNRLIPWASQFHFFFNAAKSKP